MFITEREGKRGSERYLGGGTLHFGESDYTYFLRGFCCLFCLETCLETFSLMDGIAIQRVSSFLQLTSPFFSVCTKDNSSRSTKCLKRLNPRNGCDFTQ